MLAYQWQADSGIPVVFLHGLLGSQDDWAEVFALLRFFPDIRPLAIDLPFHHQSAMIPCTDFDSTRILIHQTLQQTITQPFYLVGYSLGGRIALDYVLHQQNPLLQGVVLEGTNIGLTSPAEKQARWENDLNWATRFETEEFSNVLNAWYQQPVFANLTPNKRAELIQKRQNNDGRNIARMLRATSLAKQPYYGSQIVESTVKMQFFIGERDLKFRQMAQIHQLDYRLIENAGHNAHQENPSAFVYELMDFIWRT